MERNWLIRTSQFQILGPVSKEKVLDFFKKGALGPNDEICTGNGYWFCIREKDLVQKYLLSNNIQDFNPISEARTVLARNGDVAFSGSKKNNSVTDQTLVLNMSQTSGTTKVLSGESKKEKSEKQDELKIPKNEDLDYPDLMAPINNDILEIKTEESVAAPKEVAPKYNMPLASDLRPEGDEPVHLPKQDDLAYPEIEVATPKKAETNSTEAVGDGKPSKAKIELSMDNIENLSGLEVELSSKKTKPIEEATKTHMQSTSPGSSKGVLVNNQNVTTTMVADKADSRADSKSDLKIETKKAEIDLRIKGSDRSKFHIKPQDERKLIADKKKISKNKDTDFDVEAAEEEITVTPAPRRFGIGYVVLIIFLVALILGGIVYYYQEILNQPLPI